MKLQDVMKEIRIAQREHIVLDPKFYLEFYQEFPQIKEKLQKIFELSKEISKTYEEIFSIGE